MKNLVLTMAIGPDFENMAKLTHPTIWSYAAKIGAEFKCISERKLAQTSPHWDKFQIHDLLDEYDRILFVDTDIIIRHDCPSLFDIVPEGKLGMFNEGRFTDRSKELMIDICNKYNVTLPGWDGRYFNSGVMVISRGHKELFVKPKDEHFSFYEQSFLNMRIAQLQIPMFELDYKFNRMTCMDRFTGEDRHASYIIHYAGYPNINKVLPVIRKDLDRWQRDVGRYNYGRHLFVSVNGGLGDQFCAEPSIRYMKRVLYPTDEIVLATHWPRLFRHLERDGITVTTHEWIQLKEDTPYWVKSSLPGPDTVNWFVVSHLLCHSVDYCSMALLKRTLPMEFRQPQFELEQHDFEELYEQAGTNEFKDALIIHPGRHWDSKTLPKQYWQDLVDGFLDRGQELVFIGKDEPGDPPDFVAGARGTVDVDVRGCLDLRNKLTLGGVCALLSQSKGLLSNDSAPIHLAGAFDNWIFLIPTCKHADHILPYRKGSVAYKSKSFCKRLVLDDIESRPTEVNETSADIENVDWERYLTVPQEVVEGILEEF